jgi:hypothetical protein
MVKKKVNRIINYSVLNARDYLITQTLNHYHYDFGVTILNIISTNPIEITVGLLSIKLGITNKILIGLIIAFLI